MGFVNLSLALGGLLVAIPIVLHLLLRQQPQRLVFPALRFVKERQVQNTRTLQLRHWLLLALRCLAIVLLALALARPRAASAVFGNWLIVALMGILALVALSICLLSVFQQRSHVISALAGLVAAMFVVGAIFLASRTLDEDPHILLGDQQAPVAALLLFDTAPRMLYQHDNRTRLAAAQEIADWLITQLPPDSQIAVLESRLAASERVAGNDDPGEVLLTRSFLPNTSSAKKAVGRLQPIGTSRALPEALEAALQLAQQSELERKEIYIFSDLSQPAWQANSTETLKRMLEQVDNVSFYIIDVGIEDPLNFTLTNLRVAADAVALNSSLGVEVDVATIGPGGSRVVELFLEEPSATGPIFQDGQIQVPEAASRGRQMCELPENGSQTLRFSVADIPQGVHHGRLTVAGQDGLSIDDVRYFTIRVQAAWPVLVVAPDKVNTALLTDAISPQPDAESGRSSFQLTTRSQSDLPNLTLTEYAAVCLLDPQPVTPADWTRLSEYVRQGGGLMLALGHNAAAQPSFNGPAAQSVLPGQLARITRSQGFDLFLAPQRFDHPILKTFRSIPRDNVPWDLFPIFRHWDIDEVTPDARVVISFSNGKPALIERTIGAGRVIVATTPITEVGRPAGWKAWNELAGENDWPRFTLVNDLFYYLVEQAGEVRLNYQAGQQVLLANDRTRHPLRYQLFTPVDEPQDVIARDDRISIRYTDFAGNYRLKGVRQPVENATNVANPEIVLRGFSVNLPNDAGQLARIETERLDALLGKDNYNLARSQDDIELEVRETRIGREFYPYLLAMLAFVLAMEQALANRFYKSHE